MFIRGADKSLAFPICSTTKRIFLGWVKLDQRSHKCVELRGEYVNTFFQSRSLFFFIKPKTYQTSRKYNKFNRCEHGNEPLE
jgi:hypothetical protein